jgi:hypothetical protein
LSFLLLAEGGGAVGAVSITVAGDWSPETFGQAHLKGGAGTDFDDESPSTSSDNQVDIDIGDTDTTWQVSVHRVDVVWHDSMELQILGTSAGTGLRSFAWAATDWRTLSTTPTLFFAGSLARADIRCQLRVYRHVAAGAGTFATDIVFTITGP